MVLRALGDDGGGRDSDIAEAFRYAGAHGARVVNASLGGSGASHTLDAAISQSRTPCSSWPPAMAAPTVWATTTTPPRSGRATRPNPNVVCVGASTTATERGDFSNYGAQTVDLFAPGVKILSAILDATRPRLQIRRYASSTARRWPPRTSPASRRSCCRPTRS